MKSVSKFTRLDTVDCVNKHSRQICGQCRRSGPQQLEVMFLTSFASQSSDSFQESEIKVGMKLKSELFITLI